MGANPSRRERWPIPRTTRHVWVLRDKRFKVPWQGYVVEWRGGGSKWSALVVYAEEDDPERPLVQRWISPDRLVPVRSIPEEVMRNPIGQYRWARGEE